MRLFPYRVLSVGCLILLPTNGFDKSKLSHYFAQNPAPSTRQESPACRKFTDLSKNPHVCYNIYRSLTAFLASTTHLLSTMCDFEKFIRDSPLSKWHQDTYTAFPLDPVKENTVRFHVRGALFSAVAPTPFRSCVRLAAASAPALRLLDLTPEHARTDHLLQVLAGNAPVPGVTSLAHRYGGHQFGYWAEQLGDGRAHLIAEYTNSQGDRWELQLKGSGRTPYSRFGDGRAVVRSSVREFLCSEAMHALDVPTSRAATLVTSDDRVPRDVFYNGAPALEPTAVVLRLAPSWFRFGSFEMPTADGDLDNLRLLTRFVIEKHFPNIDLSEDDAYLDFLRTVAAETGKMIAGWQNVGFTHGVMNTDNMSILSITIDYGPFGFMEAYDEHFVPNHSDDMGRYSYGNQEKIGRWNVNKLCVAVRPLLSAAQAAKLGTVVDAYNSAFETEWRRLFSARLGLPATAESAQLARRLLALMSATGSDFTMTFRQLGDASLEQLSAGRLCDLWALKTVSAAPGWTAWLADYTAQLELHGISDTARQSAQKTANPRYVLRNWMAQRAIEGAERGEFEELELLLQVLQTPYKEQLAAEERGFAAPPPDWARNLTVSCSS